MNPLQLPMFFIALSAILILTFLFGKSFVSNSNHRTYQTTLKIINIYCLLTYAFSLLLFSNIFHTIIKKLSEANQEVTVLNERLKAENSRMNTELQITRHLQQMVLPKEYELNQIPDWKLLVLWNLLLKLVVTTTMC